MRYKIGTKVRLVKPHFHSDMKGAEGTIIGHLEDDWYEVNYPNFPLKDGTTIWHTMHDRLEPIQYDGNEPTKWSECLWQPNLETIK